MWKGRYKIMEFILWIYFHKNKKAGTALHCSGPEGVGFNLPLARWNPRWQGADPRVPSP